MKTQFWNRRRLLGSMFGLSIAGLASLGLRGATKEGEVKSACCARGRGKARAGCDESGGCAVDGEKGQLHACVKACRDCAKQCKECSTCCRDAETKCEEVCLACHHLCLACALQCENGGKLHKEFCELCAKQCLECAAQCEACGKDCCKACAEMCRKCAAACKACCKA